MKLSQLDLAGFRGFKGQVTIPFAPGFTVITGRNGSGKAQYVMPSNMLSTGS